MSNQSAFQLERYKYILLRKQSLNEATFKIATIYQVIAVGLGIAQYNVFASYQAKTIDKFLLCSATIMLLVFFVMLTLLIFSMLIGGVFAWLKYRREEAELEEKVFNQSSGNVSAKSVFRWYETYLVATVFVLGVIVVLGYLYILLPKISLLQ